MKQDSHILEKYPWLVVRRIWSDNEIVTDENGEPDNWALHIPQGWWRAFGEAMINEIDDLLKRTGTADKFYINDIRDMFGALRWYCNQLPDEIYDEFHKIELKYSQMSKKICIDCGEPAEMRYLNRWYLPLCDSCFEETIADNQRRGEIGRMNNCTRY